MISPLKILKTSTNTDMEIQEICKTIGESGCYFLTLLHFAKVEEDALKYYKLFVKNKWLDEDCFVRQPAEIARCLFGGSWQVKKSDKDDFKADFAVLLYYNPKTGLRHFTARDWDPLGDSNTRKNGYIESYRLFYRV